MPLRPPLVLIQQMIVIADNVLGFFPSPYNSHNITLTVIGRLLHRIFDGKRDILFPCCGARRTK